jgi:uncharacterized protein with HEPN domain
MPSDPAETALRDILYHIELAVQFAAETDYVAFSEDLRTLYAVTRCLEIISEASRRLPEELKARYTKIAWKRMAAHYVWDTLQRDLPQLRIVVERELGNKSLR